jgi:hypothetical protein
MRTRARLPRSKRALSERFSLAFSVQVPLPEQAPVQRAKRQPGADRAENVAVLPTASVALHRGGQAMSGPVTDPEPPIEIVNVKPGGSGICANVAVRLVDL